MSISSNVIDIDNIIKVKEKELQQIQQIRNGQLEQLLKEREQTISMITQKYDLLKDDFQYNLQLIEARDKEINRLETMIHQLHDEQQQFEQQINELKALVDNLHEQERTQKTKYDQERLMHKKILEELKSAIESLQWQTNQEKLTKDNELSSLKKQIEYLNYTKEEALEIQRKDLSQTFENIMKQREEIFRDKENTISINIVTLENKFEKLSMENLKYKSNVHELNIRNEHLIQENTKINEKLLELQFMNDELQHQQLQSEDNYQRRIEKLLRENKEMKENNQKEKQYFDNLQTKLKQQLVLENEGRKVIEKHLEEYQMSSQSDLQTIHNELIASQQKIITITQELSQQKITNEELLHRITYKQQEYDQLATKHIQLTSECEALRYQYDVQSLENKQYQDKISSLESSNQKIQQNQYEQRIEYDKNASEQVKQLQTAFQDQIHTMKLQHETNLQQQLHNLQSLHQNELKQLQDTLSQENNYQTKLKEQLISQQEYEITSLQKKIKELEELLSSEKIETNALKLRLTILQQNPNPNQNTQQSNNNNNNNNANNPRYISTNNLRFSKENQPLGTLDTNNSLLSLGENFFESPSPVIQPNYHRRGPDTFESNQSGFFSEPHSPVMRHSSHQQQQDFHRSEEMEALVSENDKLKKIIKDMREDIQQMKDSALPPPPPPVAIVPIPTTVPQTPAPAPTPTNPTPNTETTINNPDISPEKVKSLETKLMKSREEIQRLKNERKKLMDHGNEMKSALQKLQQKQMDDSFEMLEDMRQDNLESILQWIQSSVPEEKLQDLLQQRTTRRFVTRQPSPPDVWDHNERMRQGINQFLANENQDYDAQYRQDYPSESIARKQPYMTPTNTTTNTSTMPKLTREHNMEIIGENLTSRDELEEYSRPMEYTYSVSRGQRVPIPTSNSHRTTLSQAQALQKLKHQQATKLASLNQKSNQPQQPSRKIVNYALKGNEQQETI